MKLEESFQKSRGSQKNFKFKKVLFIGSESYDAPAITIIEGLQELGFEIYTIKKPNINSWSCNKVIENPNNVKFDFVLSNLSWGTRWSYYQKYKLNSYLRVLIDGDDHPWFKFHNWREKFEHYKKNYAFEPREEIKMKIVSPYRWVEDLADYKPDIVFTAQKQFDDKESFYLPFGIHREYFWLSQNKSTSERRIDFCHIDGPGIKRKKMLYLIKLLSFMKILPGRIFNGSVRGKTVIPEEEIRRYFSEDEKSGRPHSYHRWTMGRDYFRALNNSKVLIYPGIDSWPFWDSKRPWEAYASGCLVLIEKPCIDVSEYPVTEVSSFAVYNSYFEFIEKCRYLYKHQDFLDKLREDAVNKAKKYFTPKIIANYFLQRIK